VYRWWPSQENVRLTIGLFDLGNVISRTGFRSHVLHNLTIPFSNPPAITLIDTPSGWLEKATEQMISLQWTCPTRSPFTVQSLRSLPPPAKTPKLSHRSPEHGYVRAHNPGSQQGNPCTELICLSDKIYRQLMTEAV